MNSASEFWFNRMRERQQIPEGDRLMEEWVFFWRALIDFSQF
jgi:hypothetical protein